MNKYIYQFSRTVPETRRVPAYVPENGGIRLEESVKAGEYFIPEIRKSHFHNISVPDEVPLNNDLVANPDPDMQGSFILAKPDNTWFNTIHKLIRDLSGVGIEYDPSYATNIVAVYYDPMGLSQVPLLFGLKLDSLTAICYKAITDIAVDGELSVSYGQEYWDKYNAETLYKMGEYVHIADLMHRCYGDGRNCTSNVNKLYGRCIDGYYHYKIRGYGQTDDVSNWDYSMMDKNHVIHTGFDYYYRSDATLPPDEICVENNIFNYMGRFYASGGTDLDSLSIRPLSLVQKIDVIWRLIDRHPDTLSILINGGHVDSLDNVVLKNAIERASLSFIKKHIDHLDIKSAITVLKRLDVDELKTALTDPLFPSPDMLNSDYNHIVDLLYNENIERIEHIIHVLRPPCSSVVFAIIYNYVYGTRWMSGRDVPFVSSSISDEDRWKICVSLIERHYTQDILVKSLAQPPLAMLVTRITSDKSSTMSFWKEWLINLFRLTKDDKVMGYDVPTV
jgi:hypothetical protein